MPNRPLICVSPRWEPRSYPGFTEDLAPLIGPANDFMHALVDAGGMPVSIPMTDDEALLDDYVALCDGLAIAGGQDVNPELWGEDPAPYGDKIMLSPERDAIELALIARFRMAHKPIFATCRGMQILNVAYGGSLDMDIFSRKAAEGMVAWRHTGILTSPAHCVEVEAGSLLSRVVEADRIQVNSSHHCSVKRLGEGLVLSGHATDGIPEAIEDPEEKFVLGVQWHPECTWETIPTDALIWKAFIDACR